MSVLISIIVPVYNVELYIKDCLLSIANQSSTNDIECILVDDCGGDQSMNIVNDFIDNYDGTIKFSIIKHKCNMGLSAARNSGLKVAQGDYVLFVDSDDEITPVCIEELRKPLSQSNFDVIISNFSVIGGDDIYPRLHSRKTIFGHKNIINNRLTCYWCVMAWGKLFRKEFLFENNIEFLGGIIHEDELFDAEITSVLKSVCILGDVYLYKYKIRNDSIMSSTKYNRKCYSFVKILYHYGVFLRRHKLYNDDISVENIKYLFYNACRISMEQSVEEFYRSYPQYKNAIPNDLR